MKPTDAIAKRILVRGVNWLGDAVMSTPALLRLREARPEAHITLLTPRKLAELWPQHPALDAVISFEAGENVWRVARRLRQKKFDLALVLPNSPRSALEVWLAGIPERVGYARNWRNFFLTRCVPPRTGEQKMQKRSLAEIKRLAFASGNSTPRPGALISAEAHHLHQYLHLAAALGASATPLPPRLELAPAELEMARAKFLANDSATRSQLAAPSACRWLGLNPGAEYGPAKRWPVENFIAAARAVSARVANCKWMIFGGAKDARLGSQITEQLGASAINLAGKTSLRELMALLKQCEALLTNDTGPMHVAAALGTPVIALFGSTSPELTGPGVPGDPRHVLLRAGVACAPCFRRECPLDFRCMNDLQIKQVIEAVLR